MLVRFFLSTRTFLLILSILLLSGCSKYPVFSYGRSSLNYEAQANRYREKAGEVMPPQATYFRVQAAEFYVKARLYNQASETLMAISNTDECLPPLLKRRVFEARYALIKREFGRALTVLQTILHGMPDTELIVNHRIALLLPTQGQFAGPAKTIRDGFLAAYYQKGKNPNAETKIQIYDTSSSGGAQSAYEKAMADRADLIVGPLTKEDVQALAKQNLSVPVIALNSLMEDKPIQQQMYQFGLIPEDEVHAAVDLARRKGIEKALMIAPDSEWGHRMHTAFKRAFESKGGKVIDHQFVKSDQELPNQIRNALRFENNKIRRDVNAVFLAAQPELARKVKPLLNEYQAEKLPVFATASVYRGNPSPSKDQNLNGVYFCDMPWVLDNSASYRDLRSSLAKLWPESFSQSPRFFALGMDAFKLASEYFDVNHVSPKSWGMTGYLSMEGPQRITRGLVCAKFEQGMPVAE